MTTITEQQPRAEDGRFAAKPPESDPTTGPQADATRDASASPQGGEKAPARPAAANDPYEAVATEMLGASPAPSPDSVVSGREPAKTAEPSSQPAQPGPDREAPHPSATAQQTEAEKTAEAIKPYGDMSAKTHALLKSVPGGLVTPDEWAAMDLTERVAHVASVTDFRNNAKRQYNQRQQQQTPAPAQAAPVAPAPQQRPTELGQPPQAQGARESGQLPPDVKQHLDAMATEYGPDSPVYKAFAAQAQQNARLEAQLGERDRQFQAQAQQQAQERDTRITEDQVFDQLETRYPSLSDPRKRDELRQACRDWFQIRVGRGESVDGVSVITDVVHRSLFPETQQRQDNRDTDASARIRAGSFDRGAPKPPSSNAKPATSDPYQAVADGYNGAVKEGLSGEAAVDRAVRYAQSQR